MSQFRVTLSSSRASGAITHDGYLGKHAEFRIQRLSDRTTYSYEGHGGGKQFELRCQLLVAAGGVLVEATDTTNAQPGIAWKEAVVNLALAEAERLQ